MFAARNMVRFTITINSKNKFLHKIIIEMSTKHNCEKNSKFWMIHLNWFKNKDQSCDVKLLQD